MSAAINGLCIMHRASAASVCTQMWTSVLAFSHFIFFEHFYCKNVTTNMTQNSILMILCIVFYVILKYMRNAT